MDVGDILDFKPEVNAKRTADDETIAIPAKLRKKFQEIEKSRKDLPLSQLTDQEKLRMLQAVEDSPLDLPSEMKDIAAMKKTILSFQKKVTRNQEARIKFPDNPEKFMDSEVELHDEIVEMRAIATQPDIYQLLSESNAIRTILSLVAHDNVDVSVSVIELLHELSDVDTLNESQEGAVIMSESLAEAQAIATLVQNMDRLDDALTGNIAGAGKDSDEAQALFNSLATVENLLEFKPELSIDAAHQGLLLWIMKRLKVKTTPPDPIKAYSSEILAIMLQNSDEVKGMLGEIEGIDTLLQQLSAFKRRDPASNEDSELMENTFDCVCAALMLLPNRDRFLKGEGLQLMNLLLREKKMSRYGALKVLNHALAGSEGADNCIKFIDILGLRTIFPLFIKPPKISKKCGYSVEECEEHIVSVIFHLCRNTAESAQRNRLMCKFAERDFEKVDRLMELHFKYLGMVRQCDAKIDRIRRQKSAQGEPLDDEDEDEFYMQRLEAGLYTLQLIDYIILSASGADKNVASKIHMQLKLRGFTKDTIRDVIREYASQMGDARSEQERDKERSKLITLVDNF